MRLTIDGLRAYVSDHDHRDMVWMDHKLVERENRGDKILKSLIMVDSENRIFVPYGAVNTIERIYPKPLDIIGREPITDRWMKTRPSITNTILPGIELLDFQLYVISKSIQAKHGLVISPTGSGKTEMLLAICKYLIDNMLSNKIVITVESEALAQQIRDRALIRGFTDSEIGYYSSGRKFVPKAISVFVIDTLNNARKSNNEDWKFIKDANCVIVDEAHHLRAKSYTDTVFGFDNLEYFLGFSASPFLEHKIEDDVGDMVVNGMLPYIIAEIPYTTLYQLGILPMPVIHFRQIPARMATYKGRPNEIYDKFLVENQDRNNDIVFHARKFTHMGFQVLILVQRKEHCRYLVNELRDLKTQGVLGNKRGYVADDTGVYETKIDYKEFLDAFSRKEISIAIISQVGDEGVDMPSVGVVIMAGAGKSRIKIKQRSGRGLRRKKVGRNLVYILDYWDRGHVYLLAQAKRRLELYKSMNAIFKPAYDNFIGSIIDHAVEVKEITGNT